MTPSNSPGEERQESYTQQKELKDNSDEYLNLTSSEAGPSRVPEAPIASPENVFVPVEQTVADHQSQCLSSLEASEVAANDLDNVCSICRDFFTTPSSLIPCGHRFDFSCIKEWLVISCTRKLQCPLCRDKVTTIQQDTVSEPFDVLQYFRDHARRGNWLDPPPLDATDYFPDNFGRGGFAFGSMAEEYAESLAHGRPSERFVEQHYYGMNTEPADREFISQLRRLLGLLADGVSTGLQAAEVGNETFRGDCPPDCPIDHQHRVRDDELADDIWPEEIDQVSEISDRSTTSLSTTSSTTVGVPHADHPLGLSQEPVLEPRQQENEESNSLPNIQAGPSVLIFNPRLNAVRVTTFTDLPEWLQAELRTEYEEFGDWQSEEQMDE